MEKDGDLASQEDSATRPGFSGPKEARQFQLGALRAVILRGKGAAAALGPACKTADLVIVAAAAEPVAPAPKGCFIIDRSLLDRSGALAGYLEANTLTLHPTRQATRI